jgi:DNA repair exonuclease SbcCD nuclease subunit
MKRNAPTQNDSTKKPIAILTADIHLRLTTPTARTDDYQDALLRKIEFLRSKSVGLGVPVLDAGDLFDNWRASPEAESIAMQSLPFVMVTIPGNHDIPKHNINLYYKSSLHVLDAAKRIHVGINPDTPLRVGNNMVYFFPYGTPIEKMVDVGENIEALDGECHIALYHGMVIGSKDELWPGAKEYNMARALLQRVPGFDVIVTGHNHKTFTAEYEGRHLINPGSMMRMDADQMDHQPSFFILYSDNSYTQQYIPIEKDVLTRQHIITSTERDERMLAFIERMGLNYEIGLSFERNLENHIADNKIRNGTKEKIWEAVE